MSFVERQEPSISQILTMDNLQTLKTADFRPAQAKAIKNQHGAKSSKIKRQLACGWEEPSRCSLPKFRKIAKTSNKSIRKRC